MQEILTSRDKAMKYHVVRVPNNIDRATIEVLTFRGAPAFLGTMLAKLHFADKCIILYSEMCGVVDRVLIDNEQVVCSGQELIELRNTNVSRDKAGKKMQPASLPIPKPFFKQKNSQINMTDSGLENNTSNLPVPKPVSFFSVKKNLIRPDLHSSVSENAILRLLPYRL
ncbi:MAG: hypothetical protein K0S11_168 [Gammaproteobacteria bacterium]|jgi:hypothetical protein|nr:hypothetical protein [Gammaproteobacteria bacterium]